MFSSRNASNATYAVEFSYSDKTLISDSNEIMNKEYECVNWCIEFQLLQNVFTALLFGSKYHPYFGSLQSDGMSVLRTSMYITTRVAHFSYTRIKWGYVTAQCGL